MKNIFVKIERIKKRRSSPIKGLVENIKEKGEASESRQKQ